MEMVLQLSGHPMVIVTVAAGGERDGCLVGYHSPVSIHPSRYMVCLSSANRTYDLATRANTLVVHHIESHQRSLARLFGEETGYEIDKFARCAWEPGPDGAPVLSDVATWWAGQVMERIPLGDHTGFVLEPFLVQHGEHLEPLDSTDASTFDAGTRATKQPAAPRSAEPPRSSMQPSTPPHRDRA